MDKVDTVEQVLAGVTDGATLAVGGFGLCGLPSTWIAALHRSTVTDLRIVSNKCGIDDWGLGLLLGDRQISRVTASYVGRTREFARQYLASELEVELIPQGTLAEGCARADAGFPRSTRQPVPAPLQEAGVAVRAVARPASTITTPRLAKWPLAVCGITRRDNRSAAA